VAVAADLGVGCGAQAVGLAGHAGTVIATDASERALAFARLTAALCGQSWELRHGDLLAPLAAEQIDLLVSNPPYVITPRVAGAPRWTYRDAGRVGDGALAELVGGAGAVLSPGGLAVLLGNWEVHHGESWRDGWQRWLSSAGLDAWVVQRGCQDPAEYAETWIRDAGRRLDEPEADRMCRAWLDDFEARGVEQIGFGVVVLSRPRRPRPTWAELTEHEGPVAARLGPTVLDAVRARSWLAEHAEADLLATTWVRAADLVEERRFHPGEQDPVALALRRQGGLSRELTVDAVLAAFVGVCDGQLSAGVALTAIAAVLGLDAQRVRAEAVPALRRLVAEGVIAPAHAAPTSSRRG
jgi:methylase of polypeptide subunit release factors